ncbi:MAG: hypothetical protein WCF33_08545 [Pseudonocardiaceae bacterium]
MVREPQRRPELPRGRRIQLTLPLALVGEEFTPKRVGLAVSSRQVVRAAMRESRCGGTAAGTAGQGNHGEAGGDPAASVAHSAGGVDVQPRVTDVLSLVSLLILVIRPELLG